MNLVHKFHVKLGNVCDDSNQRGNSFVKSENERKNEGGTLCYLPSVRVVDVQELRRSLKMTQSEFASNFGIPLSCIRNWEQGRVSPDRAARSYLAVIQRHPNACLDAIIKDKYERFSVEEVTI